MIIVRLKGGLGNQMFQYAAARRLAHTHGTTVMIDDTFLRGKQAGCTQRKLELNNLKVSFKIARSLELIRITGQKTARIETMLIAILTRLGHFKDQYLHFSENDFSFDPAVLALPENTYLNGYWQSERYFLDIAEIIRNEFSVRNELSGKNKEFATLIQESNSVSVHIRRGDYATNKKTNEFHGLCNKEYYRTCVNRIAAKISSPTFFVFTDDHAWVMKHFETPYSTIIVSHNDNTDSHEDMRLMSLCKHNIIANSSFSWWAAWLNRNQHKMVYAPSPWFKNGFVNTEDLLPSSWITIPGAM